MCRATGGEHARHAAIPFCLSINVLFKLPVRQTAGMVASTVWMAVRAGRYQTFWLFPVGRKTQPRRSHIAVRMAL